MPKPKPLRKSVTFQTIAGEDSTSLSSNTAIKSLIPSVTSPFLIIPFHYPLLIIGAFHFGLTGQTDKVLIRSLFTLIASQLLYGFIIRYNVHTSAPTKKKGDKEKATVSTSSVKKRNTNDAFLLIIASGSITLVLSVPVFLFVILFGAPLSSHLLETFLLSVHLSFLVFYPLLVLFKLDTHAFFSTFQLERIYRAIFTNQILTSSFLGLVGCWLGVIPIPLDWDRPWQAWPITLLTGAYVGSFVGGVISIPLTWSLSEESAY